MAKKIFLICPVRKAGDDVNERIGACVAELKSQGHKVHWPKDDTKQDGDPIGNRICYDNREAMFASDEVHVWYDPESTGSCFDLGMAIVFEGYGQKVVRIANVADVVGAPPSIQLSVLIALAIPHLNPHLQKLLADRSQEFPIWSVLSHATWTPDAFTLKRPPSERGALCALGIVFAEMLTRPRKIVLGTPIEPTEGKSFNNLLLWLAEYTKDGPRLFNVRPSTTTDAPRSA